MKAHRQRWERTGGPGLLNLHDWQEAMCWTTTIAVASGTKSPANGWAGHDR